MIKVFWGSNPGIGISTSGNTTVCLGTNGSTFTFPITPSSVANNPPGTIYVVTFNDGSPSQVYTTLPTSFTHTFTTTSCGVNTPNGFLNSFYVKITASNPCGSSSSTVEPFVISEKPEADFTMPDSACKDVYVDIENNYYPRRIIPSRITSYKKEKSEKPQYRDIMHDSKTELEDPKPKPYQK